VFPKILHCLQFRRIGSLLAVQTTCHPVRTLICPLFHPSKRRAIPSERQTDQASFVRTTCISVWTIHCIEKLLFQIASIRTTQLPILTTYSDQITSDFFQNQIWEDCYNRSDDVDFCPDALLCKARIVIQIQPSRRLPTLVRMRAQLIWKLRVKDYPTGRSPPLVRTLKAIYGNYLQRTCNRSEESVSPSERGSQTGKIFNKNLGNFGRIVVCLDGARIFHSSRPFEP
jgi:hypothetical protein